MDAKKQRIIGGGRLLNSERSHKISIDVKDVTNAFSYVEWGSWTPAEAIDYTSFDTLHVKIANLVRAVNDGDSQSVGVQYSELGDGQA